MKKTQTRDIFSICSMRRRSMLLMVGSFAAFYYYIVTYYSSDWNKTISSLSLSSSTTTLSSSSTTSHNHSSGTAVSTWVSQVHKCDPIDIPSVKNNENFLSQDEEDKHLLRNWFNGLCGGRYLEMGGLDGRIFSNTFVFQALLNWTGVLIELDPPNYEKILENRRKDIAVNAAVCRKKQILHYAASRGAVSGIWEFAAPSFREQWWKDTSLEQTKGKCMLPHQV